MKPVADRRRATTSTSPTRRPATRRPAARARRGGSQDNLVFVPRPVWIVEGESTDPYYNFGKVIMYFDKDMYRIYWKLVHNRAGEYFYTAMCGYHFVEERRRPSPRSTPNMVIGVNDKTNRAALGGRYQSSFIERNWDPELLLAAHADPHDRLTRRRGAARARFGAPLAPRARAGGVRGSGLRRRGARAPRASGSPATARSSTTSSAG